MPSRAQDRPHALLLVGAFCCVLLLQLAAAATARTISAKVLIFAAATPYSSRLNLALVVAVELRLRCWPGGYGDTKTTGCQVGLAGENLEQELCLIFSLHLLL